MMTNISEQDELISVAVRRMFNWVCIHREGLEDSRLSFRARGILAYLSAQSTETVPSAAVLALLSPSEGPRGIQAALRELERAGYTISREE